MPFIDELALYTAAERQSLVTTPIITRALAGQITRDEYVAFLTQAYQHVRHTVPLLMAVGSRLPEHLLWLRSHIVEYATEEEGHDHWILNDIAAVGADPLHAERSEPSVATDAMIAYAYDTAMRRNPIGFFGMVFVLEGTSVALALAAAEGVQRALRLPANAMTYLRSHGQLDQQHVHHLGEILNRLDRADDMQAIKRCAHVMFRLYGNIFREIDQQFTQLRDARACA
jgi:pyrroloquinoline quinone (PQQ) biosynthesis protein C